LILNDLGVKRFGANPLGVETTWDESPWGWNDLYLPTLV
jgi:hypothetical protein